MSIQDMLSHSFKYFLDIQGWCVLCKYLLLNVGHKGVVGGIRLFFYLLQINSKCPFKCFWEIGVIILTNKLKPAPAVIQLALTYPMYDIIATTNFNELLGIEVSKLLP